jgi:hypothetical protein
MARLISSILEAEQLATWLHDNASWKGEDVQRESVDLLWAVVHACDIEKIRSAIGAAKKYIAEVEAEKHSE